MSEQKLHSVDDRPGKIGPASQSYQPRWMAHWMRPSSKAAAKGHEHGNVNCHHVSRGNDLTNGYEVSRLLKESRVTEPKTSEIFSSKGAENETAYWSLLKHGEDTDNKQALRQEFGHCMERGQAIGGKGGGQFLPGIQALKETSIEGCNFAGEGSSKSRPSWMGTHSSPKSRCFDKSNLFHSATVESSRHGVPLCSIENYDLETGQKEGDKGKAPLIVRPPIVPNTLFSNSNSMVVGQEHCYKDNQSADLICERKIDGCSASDISMDVHFGDLNTSLLFDAPSASHHNLPTYGQAWFQKIYKQSDCEMIPSECILAERTESKKSCCNCHSLEKLPHCAHDMKTMRICATVKATSEGFPRFSQTTHSLLIRKDVTFSKESDVLRTAESITKMSGDAFRGMYGLLPFSSQGDNGVEIHPLSSSLNSKRNINFGGVKASKVTLKNESSAETDTMDVDLFKEENSNPGTNTDPLTKGFNIYSTQWPLIGATSSREVNHLRKSTVLPDMNLELPASPATACSSQNMHPISSRTQSLEMDLLLSHSEHPKKNSNLSQGDSFEVDPTMRWVKRLKQQYSNSSSHGAKSSNLSENTSDKMRKFNKRILESGISSTEQNPGNLHPNQIIMSDKNEGLWSADEECFTATGKKGKELLLSQAWIRRWLRNGSKVTEREHITVVCEPQSFKLAPDDYQKEQFPSIAAMALMGKAMNGLQPCVLQKCDSFTVWKTKATSKQLG